MFHAPEERNWDYVIRCKHCERNIPVPVETMPDQYFVAVCPLCAARRNYLPAELFQGRLSYELIRRQHHGKWDRSKQQRASAKADARCLPGKLDEG